MTASRAASQNEHAQGQYMTELRLTTHNISIKISGKHENVSNAVVCNRMTMQRLAEAHAEVC